MRSSHSDAYRAFLVQLVAARTLRRMTQREVAKALNLPQSQVSRMETGERRVDVIELSWFAKLYRKPLSYFVEVDR